MAISRYVVAQDNVIMHKLYTGFASKLCNQDSTTWTREVSGQGELD